MEHLPPRSDLSSPPQGGAQGGAEERDAARSGFFYALAAYGIWGMLPLYFRLVDYADPLEVLVHRVIWAVPIALAVIAFQNRLGELKALFLHRKTLLMMMVTAGLISLNWGVYVWAISINITSEAALGYYINPLITVCMGYLFLGERLTRLQICAVLIVALAVLMRAVLGGTLPWIALVLAFSFAIYGYVRKTVAVGPTQGFLMEVVILSPFALAYLFYLTAHGESHFSFFTPSGWLLMLAGPVTAVPLILYAFGAKLLRMATLGLMQYIAPSLIFIISFFVFDEKMDALQAMTFVMIWSALALYTWEMLRANKK